MECRGERRNQKNENSMEEILTTKSNLDKKKSIRYRNKYKQIVKETK